MNYRTIRRKRKVRQNYQRRKEGRKIRIRRLTEGKKSMRLREGNQSKRMRLRKVIWAFCKAYVNQIYLTLNPLLTAYSLRQDMLN